jgi:hypothetical protein
VIETEALKIGNEHPRTGWPFRRRTVISPAEGRRRVFHTGAVETPAGRTVFVIDPITGGVWSRPATGDHRSAQVIERQLCKQAFAEVARKGTAKRRMRTRCLTGL